MVCSRGESLTIHTNQMKLFNAIAAAAAIGISLSCSKPAQASWSQEMYNCQVSFKNNFSQTIANSGLYVKKHETLDSMAFDYCQIALSAISTGDSLSTATNLGMRHIKAKYGF